ncbi:replication endonuclease [Sulfurimonas sp.]
MLCSTKRLQNTKLYKEHNALSDYYYQVSLQKEQTQQSFYKRMILTNQDSGEVLQMNHSFEKDYKKYTKSIEQKVYALEQEAKDKNLQPIFLTLTLPSAYHPFISVITGGKRRYVAKNLAFAFDTLEEAIKEGYDTLQHIYRIFYKRVKSAVKDLLYIKVVEAHKTLIPHFHILFYAPKAKSKIIKKIFDKIVSEFELDQTDFEIIADNSSQNNNMPKTGINRASKYIMKYVTKQLKSGSDYFTARLIDGWKRKNKIRIITMSNLDLSLADFRAIYHGVDKSTKEHLLKGAKRAKVNLFYFIMKNLYQLKIKLVRGVKKLSTNRYIHNKSFKLFKVVHRTQRRGGYYYAVKSLIFFISDDIAYEKQTFNRIILNRGENYYEQ